MTPFQASTELRAVYVNILSKAKGSRIHISRTQEILLDHVIDLSTFFMKENDNRNALKVLLEAGEWAVLPIDFENFKDVYNNAYDAMCEMWNKPKGI